MEEKNMESGIQPEEKEQYRPRPAWQVWAARVGVVIVIIAFLLYCWQIANGGLG